MTSKDIFCNSPWYELHIYWDGSFGICCQEDEKLYTDTSGKYNIANMTIEDWFNSDPVRQFRLNMLSDCPLPQCGTCYYHEKYSGRSRRYNSNLKSAIFTHAAFNESFKQSPGFGQFQYSESTQGLTKTLPVDIHIDLGNYCNLACKMCFAKASSTIAAQEVKWGIEDSRKYIGTNWTGNKQVWNSFKQQLLSLPALNNIHFMGGETLITDKFEDLVDTFIEHGKFDLCFSFVSNGTLFNEKLLKKLTKFKRVGLEISIETTGIHNDYVRQGTDTKKVLDNIARYLKFCNNTSITLSLRPAPNILTIGTYIELLRYALDHKLIIKSNFVRSPLFMQIILLPESVKQLYLKKYNSLLDDLGDVDYSWDLNVSNPHYYRHIVRQQVDAVIKLLTVAQPTDVDQQLKQLVDHCSKWDKIYGFDARKLYPELIDMFERYGYTI